MPDPLHEIAGFAFALIVASSSTTSVGAAVRMSSVCPQTSIPRSSGNVSNFRSRRYPEWSFAKVPSASLRQACVVAVRPRTDDHVEPQPRDLFKR